MFFLAWGPLFLAADAPYLTFRSAVIYWIPMPGNGGANENSHLAAEGVGPDYGKDVRNAFMAGDQQASR